MPTIHREKGFRFRIYVDDHQPAHVHAVKDNGVAVIQIGSGGTSLRTAHGLTTAEINDALEIARQNRKLMLKAWRKHHGSP